MDHSHDDGHFRFLLLVSLLLFFVCVQIYVLFKWYYVGYCYYNVSLKGDKYFALDNVYPHIFWVQDEWRCIKRDFSDTGVHQTGSSGSLCFQGTSGVLSVVLTRLFTMYLLLFVKLHFSINNVFVHFMITVIFLLHDDCTNDSCTTVTIVIIYIFTYAKSFFLNTDQACCNL